MNNFLLYILEVAACQAIFCLLYILAFRNLSFFQINRIYLLSATLLSFVIPIINIPFWNAPEIRPNLNLGQNLQKIGSAITAEGVLPKDDIFQIEWFLIIIAIVYFIGFSTRFIKLIGGIAKLLHLVKTSEIINHHGVKAVHISKGPSFFAFLNYIFINTAKLDLSNGEFNQVLCHEKSHIIQKHSYDNLFMELALVICWFNPFLRIMKKELNNVHEFYADQQAAGLKGDVTNYSSLILKLSADKTDQKPYLSHQFSMSNIKQRIIMLNKQKNPKKIAFKYLAIVPCLALVLVMFSFTKKSSINTIEVSENEISQSIGKIIWKGNTLYSDSYLTEFLGLNSGDKFNEDDVNALLNYRPDSKDLSSLYMDQGYLFFSVEVKKTINAKNVDLTFEITEGQVMKIGKVTVTGNQEVKTEEILKMIELKTGDLFSRSKLISSQRNIVASRSFDPEKVIPTPIPNPENGTVDIEFKVTEY